MSVLARLPRIAVRPTTISVSSCRYYNKNAFSKFLEFVRFSPEIRDALNRKAPVVALESAVISHPDTTYGLPRPDNVEYAARAEQVVRKAGAIPATISIVNGIIYVGMMQAFFGPLSTLNSLKVSRRDLPYVLGMGRLSGGCTIAATMAIAEMVGIKVLATGGIGGVHQSASLMMDISADVGELGRTNVAVVCSGPRPYLDIGGTLEFLETRGVPVVTFRSGQDERRGWGGGGGGGGGDPAVSPEPSQTEGFVGVTETAETMLPAFYSREGRFASPLVIEDAKEAAQIIYASHKLGLDCGQLFCNPIPWDFELDIKAVEKAVRVIFKAARKKNKRNKEDIGNIISNIRKFGSGQRGEAILAERALLLNNAKMGAQIAIELSKLEGGPGRVESPIRPLPFVNNKRLTPITPKSFEEDPDSYDDQFHSEPFDVERGPMEARIRTSRSPSAMVRQPSSAGVPHFRQKIAQKKLEKRAGTKGFKGRGRR